MGRAVGEGEVEMTGGRVEGLRILYLVGPLDAPHRPPTNFRQLFLYHAPLYLLQHLCQQIGPTRPQVISGLLIVSFWRPSHCPTFQNIHPPLNLVQMSTDFAPHNMHPGCKTSVTMQVIQQHFSRISLRISLPRRK